MEVSIGICAYNEEANIGKLLTRLDRLPYEVIVVASGCTDNTVAIVRLFSGVKLIVQEKREGKASAVNEILLRAKGGIIILQGADIIPAEFCYKYLLQPFEDKQVGMVGAHPIPVDSRGRLMGKVAHLLWEVHHQSALRHPKAGEVCAFRNIVKEINYNTPVDEASVEYEITKKGYRVVYAPMAIVFNKGCETIADLLNQRRRIYHGHLLLKMEGYSVPTMSYSNLARATLSATGKHYRTLAIMTGLELVARKQARKAFSIDGYKPTIWEVSETTKKVVQ